MSAPEDSREHHDPRVIHLTEKLTDCAARLAAVEAERDELEQALEEGAKALVALHAAEARVEAAEQERDEAEANGETAMVQRDLAMARVEALSEALQVIPPERLELLADWFDADDERKGGDRGGEVQADLRNMARAARAALAALPVPEQRK